MADDEERRVKERHNVTQYYQRRGVKRTTNRQDLPRGDMTISGDPDPNANSSSDDDVEDETYVSLPRAHPCGKGLVGPSGSGSTTARDEEIEMEIEEEEGGGNGNDEEEEEIFYVEEINPTSYIHMRTPTFRIPQNPDWRDKISYKGKMDLVREKRKENPLLVEKEPGMDYRFHMAFQ
jgi:hypothetical protein